MQPPAGISCVTVISPPIPARLLYIYIYIQTRFRREGGRGGLGGVPNVFRTPLMYLVGLRSWVLRQRHFVFQLRGDRLAVKECFVDSCLPEL